MTFIINHATIYLYLRNGDELMMIPPHMFFIGIAIILVGFIFASVIRGILWVALVVCIVAIVGLVYSMNLENLESFYIPEYLKD